MLIALPPSIGEVSARRIPFSHRRIQCSSRILFSLENSVLVAHSFLIGELSAHRTFFSHRRIQCSSHIRFSSENSVLVAPPLPLQGRCLQGHPLSEAAPSGDTSSPRPLLVEPRLNLRIAMIPPQMNKCKTRTLVKLQNPCMIVPCGGWIKGSTPNCIAPRLSLHHMITPTPATALRAVPTLHDENRNSSLTETA